MNESPFSPITTKKSLADAVTDQLREAIIRGKLRPGERLTEPNLAKALKVSRSPVREALLRLEAEGLVQQVDHQGFHVWHPTVKDIQEIFTLRAMIEILASELIMDRLTELDFGKMETMFEEQRQAIEKQDHFQLTVWDLKFHTFLVERSDHSLLAEIWKKTMYRFEMLVYKRIEGDAGVSGTVLIDHREIIVALKQRDLVKISSLHREINQRVCKETLSMLINRLPIR